MFRSPVPELYRRRAGAFEDNHGPPRAALIRGAWPFWNSGGGVRSARSPISLGARPLEETEPGLSPSSSTSSMRARELLAEVRNARCLRALTRKAAGRSISRRWPSDPWQRERPGSQSSKRLLALEQHGWSAWLAVAEDRGRATALSHLRTRMNPANGSRWPCSRRSRGPRGQLPTREIVMTIRLFCVPQPGRATARRAAMPTTTLQARTNIFPGFRAILHTANLPFKGLANRRRARLHGYSDPLRKAAGGKFDHIARGARPSDALGAILRGPPPVHPAPQTWPNFWLPAVCG